MKTEKKERQEKWDERREEGRGGERGKKVGAGMRASLALALSGGGSWQLWAAAQPWSMITSGAGSWQVAASAGLSTLAPLHLSHNSKSSLAPGACLGLVYRKLIFSEHIT